MLETIDFSSEKGTGTKSGKETEAETKAYIEYLDPFLKVFSHFGAYEIIIDPESPTFYFDHQRRRIAASLRLIEKLSLEKREKKYILLHELAHLIQLMEDPDKYLETFEIAKKKAKEEKEPDLEKAYHNFFNTFLDIHANSIVRSQVSMYQKGGLAEDLPPNLYSQKAFPEKDYSKSPLSVQFIYYLLRKIMVPDEEITVSAEVREEIESEISPFGAKYSSLEDFVRKELFDSTKTTGEIFFLMKDFLMPIYEKLLAKDRERGRLGEISCHLGNFPMDGDLTEEAVKKIAESIKKTKKSGKEKYEEAMKKNFEKWAEDKGFSGKEIKRGWEIKKRTEKTVRDLEDLWENFFQRTVEFQMAKKGGFTKGAGISPERLLSQLPILLTNPSQAEIFTRYIAEEAQELIKPQKITLFLVVDLSGSMDTEKRKAVQEVVYSLNKSLINFYRNCRQRSFLEETEFPISIYYQIIGFGSLVEELTETTMEEKRERTKKETRGVDLDEELIKVVLKIARIDLGGTCDSLALELIRSQITPQVKEELEQGKEIIFVIEITDGETETIDQSKKLVESLNAEAGIYCRAIQIPGAIYSEAPPSQKDALDPLRLEKPEVLPPTGAFKEVWGEFGRRLEKLFALKETMVAILYDALKNHVSK